MWRRTVRGLALGALFSLLVPAAFAQSFLGVLERPLEGETVSGVVLVRGYALDEKAVSKIELYVDDVFQHEFRKDLARIDVIQAYPDWAGIQTKAPGFQTGFLASRFSNGPHTVHVVIRRSDGTSDVIGRRVIEIDNTINQAPFGHIDIPSGDVTHDASGSFPVTGWATDTDGVERVDVLIDGLVMQGAIYGDARPDVAAFFPDFKGILFSAFIAHIDTTRLTDGVHELSVRVTDTKKLSRTIGQRTIQVFNSEANLRPFGYLDEPLKDADVYGTSCAVIPPCQVSPCLPVDLQRHITPVRGWALDLGTRDNPGRVAYAELLVDGVKWLSTDDCRFDSTLGGYINCYGLPRFDIATYYPNYPDAIRSGFGFTLDVGTLIALGVRPGPHNIKVRVGDQEQTFSTLPDPAGVNVFFHCAPDLFDFASFGYIEFPNPNDLLGGTVTFYGWALDENGGVRTVNIYIDGQFMGPAAYGFSRPDVQRVYPHVQGVVNSGWSFTINTAQLSNSKHRLTVEVLDNAGNKSIIGSKDFYVDN
jgi:N-acetylmuramoyl-L-alanine amidase